MAKFRILKAWADVGPNGGIFYFRSGPIYNECGPLFNIWKDKVIDDLVQVEIRIPIKKVKRGKV